MYMRRSVSSVELRRAASSGGRHSSSSEDRDKALNFVRSASCNFFDITNAASTFFRSPYSKSALNNFFYKLKTLEKEWYEFGIRFADIQQKNEQLCIECDREKEKCSMYRKKLMGFNQHSQGNLERLTKLYENVKNLGKSDQMEKGSQTETSAAYKPDSLKAAKDTLNGIKELVQRRENRYTSNAKKLEFLNETIVDLRSQNILLTELLKKSKESKQVEKKVESKNFSCNKHDVKKVLEKKPLDAQQRKTVDYRPLNKEVKSRPGSKEFKKKRPNTARKPKREDPNDLLKYVEKPDDDNYELETILSIRSMLTNTIKGSSRTSHMSSIPATPEEQRRINQRGDCREVEVLKKIQLEIERKQAAIKEKIDKFNRLIIQA
ncbi:PREDICTED: uncharacterized protein LOC108567970 [Nicrophorus vespilloides]|uniref:Uncharacterized protein LOC108567970 n=1 Tax=Nicrophorus vespilloides TaxID=110193 RepID=A0ABM1NBT3_NICVS|nr:PREDICTED: uncharacterized protein LOC108567970 [Nicrophorus vespilloides]